ncbi:protein ABHD13 [Onthophagus taurus]|uniref:protein ABHD13 n=1 Tax=Onthophagus taurus TaxID=166361 RepID=UPI000C20C4A9|nr:protein ABHD13 [Onthophagus taurus]
MGSYVRGSKVLHVIKSIMMKIWAYSGIVLFICFIVYYLYGGILAFLLLLFAMTGMVYHAQDHFLYNPDMPSHSRVFVPIPSIYNLPYENLQIKSIDGTMLNMFFIHQPGERQRQSPTVVFFHGNAGNMGHRLQNCAGLYHSLHCNILMVEYRGYGWSEGYPSEEGFYMDARASIDYLYSRNDINHAEIIVFGRSLGGAVAIDLACRAEYANKIWCLIVENTFTSIPDMATVLLQWRLLNYLPFFCYKNKFISIYKAMHLRIPTLFISGLADTLVPPRMMSDLHTRCGSTSKQLLQLISGTHNETWTLPGYYHSLAVFLQNCRLQNRDIRSQYSDKIINEQKATVTPPTDSSIWINSEII